MDARGRGEALRVAVNLLPLGWGRTEERVRRAACRKTTLPQTPPIEGGES